MINILYQYAKNNIMKWYLQMSLLKSFLYRISTYSIP
nr:MAG TPA: hypothetical protein [Caudoviricetes sp.]